jgi:hypothetical protein
MRVEQLLQASSSSLKDVCGIKAGGYYVPEYQRDYRWKAGQIHRLMGDVLSGVERLVEDEEAIAFLGTLIASVKDPDENLGREPSGTLAVIDGQQRLTTFILLCIAVMDELEVRRRSAPGLGEGEDAEWSAWLEGQIDRVLEDLKAAIAEDTRHRTDPILRYRPRLIQGSQDRWGTSREEAAYYTPLPLMVLDFLEWRAATPDKAFVFRPDDHRERNPALEDAYKDFRDRYRDDVRKQLRQSIEDREETDELRFPSWEILRTHSAWRSGLFESDAPDDEIAQLLLQECEASPDLATVVRLLLYGRFLLDRVIMTLVQAQREDYALDMFDSLNTTGEPLTAIETFKPRVVRGEGGAASFRASSAKVYFDRIETYLRREEIKDEAEIAKGIVTTFFLTEAGDKVQGKLSTQRLELRSAYDSVMNDEQERVAMVRQLERVSALTLLVWERSPNVEDPRLAGQLNLSEDTRFYIDVLRKSRHEICQAILSRYYDQLILERSKDAKQAFETVVRMCLGFWVIWRSSAESTRGIDAVHRNLMKRGIPPYPPDGETRIVGSCARRSGTLPEDPNLLAEALRERLASERRIHSREAFVKQARTVGIAKAQFLARFMILAASEARVSDPERPGLTVEGRGTPDTDTLNLRAWQDARYSTVEHVAPRRRGAGDEFDDAIYSNEGEDRLGNLLALPVDVNSHVSNRSWPVKRQIYRALCSGDSATAQQELDGVPGGLSDDAKQFLAEKASRIPLLAPVLSVDEWSNHLVEERTNHMLGLVWDRVAPWLGYE